MAIVRFLKTKCACSTVPSLEKYIYRSMQSVKFTSYVYSTAAAA